MWISKVCTQTKTKILLLWHRNPVNEASMLLPKYVFKNFSKTMFCLRDIIKTVLNQ